MRTDSEVLVIYGAGGHGKVVADAAVLSGLWSMVVASDRDAARYGTDLVPGVSVRDMAALGQMSPNVHVAIGDNVVRQREFARFSLQSLVSVVHPAAIVSAFASVGAGCFMAARSVVGPDSQIGVGVVVNHGAVVDHDCRVGDFCHVAPGAVLGGGVSVESGSFLGAGSVVLPRRRICADVVVGAGAVVCADIAQPGVYVGVPARRIK